MDKMEREKYSRQILLFGEEGQEKLKAAKVFVAGAGGGLGLLYLLTLQLQGSEK